VNRWRRRLAELQGDLVGQQSAVARAVQNVQNVQIPAPAPPFEHFEQIEHGTDPRGAAPTPARIHRAQTTWGTPESERAAIVEHDGGIPHAWAEGYARLHPDHPPGDVPLRRWQTFVDDCGRFLDNGWGAKVAALGWGPLNLFGCDQERPFARIDHAGLLWLVNGDRLVELDRNRAVIERRTGGRQTFRRRPVPVGEVVLAWELVL
jgi:hypothetical protein